jgi:hypothetical protein
MKFIKFKKSFFRSFITNKNITNCIYYNCKAYFKVYHISVFDYIVIPNVDRINYK